MNRLESWALESINQVNFQKFPSERFKMEKLNIGLIPECMVSKTFYSD